MSNLQVLETSIQSAEAQFTAVQVDNSVSFHREAGFAMQVLTGNDFLAKVAMGNRQSLINAVTNVAAIGISLNPAEKQAYLVPRDGRVCLDISYMGLIDLATSSGSIAWAKAELVYENDSFELNGVDQQPTHRRDPFSSNRGLVVGAYCVAKLPNGDYLTEAMSKADLDRIKGRSQSGKKGSGPWATDEGEMQRKTVVKRASKYWPKSERLAKAIDMLDTDGGEGYADLQPKALSDDRMAELLAGVAEAKTEKELTEQWQEGVAYIKAHGSQANYTQYRAAVEQRGAQLKDEIVDVQEAKQ